jgi:serine/threonine protein kinase/Tol biopolymer transport system component
VTLTPGTRLDAYEVTALLGTGGMGAVYRARDTRLNRDVAIKVLPDIFTGGSKEDRLARFEREAQTLASLNHPNIAHIYGLVDLPDGGRGLVMEYVDGDNLAARLTHGALPLDEAMAIARQIADALEAAHEHGIVHRDLKPANVMVNADGVVKVLDFGLAKAADPSGMSAAGVAESPTFTAHMTQFGMIIGTAAYMSPEQARGKTVDRRADIWAFGVVLYEMITGRRAFSGEEMSDVLASVLRQDIDWSALPANTPPRLRQLLERCLERDPKSRLRDIGEARVTIARIESGAPDSSSSNIAVIQSAVTPRSGWTQTAAVVITTAILTTAGIVGVLRPWARTATAPAVARFSLLPPPGSQLYPDSTGVAISPDGTMVAFVVGGLSRSESQLWVRSLSSMTSRRLDDADGAMLPFWSPDGRRIGFFTNTKLKTIAVSGGRSDVLCDAPGGRGAAWNAANVIVFAPDASGPLYRISANGGSPTPVTSLDAAQKEYAHRFPTFLPDGDHFVYASLPGHNGQFEIYASSLSGGAASRTRIGAMESAPVYANPGWLLYSRQGVLVAHAFDTASLKLTGDPIQMEDEPSMVLDPALSFTSGRPVSVSATGALAYYSSPSLNTVAEWYDAEGRPVGTLDLPQGHYEHVTMSPDGSHAVFVKSISPSESSLWLVDLTRGSAVPLSSGKGRNDSPVWSPDGSRVVFAADRDGPQNIYVKTVGDAAPEQVLFKSEVLFKIPASWSPDGAWISINQVDPSTAQNVWLLPATGGPLKLFYAGPTRDNAGAISPDGHWITHISDETGRFQLYAQSFPTPGHRVQVSQAGAVNMWWTRDSRQLVYVGDDMRTLWRVDVTPAGAALSIGTPVKLGVLPPNIAWVVATPDRQKFLALAPERTGTPSMTVVENWRASLDK